MACVLNNITLCRGCAGALMTSFDLYIGDLDDPKFHWEGGDWNGNSPRGVTGVHVSVDRFTFDKFTNMIDEGELPGIQADWGCWVARLKREEIEAVLSSLGVTGLSVRTLEDGMTYGLVALEG